MLKALKNARLEEEELKFYRLHSPRIGAATNASQFISDLELEEREMALTGNSEDVCNPSGKFDG